MQRWQDWANIGLGAWMFVSPWLLGFSHYGGSDAMSALLLGTAIVLFASLATRMPQAWEEGINSFLGVCLMASPWVLGFENQSTPRSNAVIVGLLVTSLAAWAMLEDVGFRERMRTRLHMRRH